jgi:hypothetical protein
MMCGSPVADAMVEGVEMDVVVAVWFADGVVTPMDGAQQNTAGTSVVRSWANVAMQPQKLSPCEVQLSVGQSSTRMHPSAIKVELE